VKGTKLTILLKAANLASSASEAARLIKQGGVYIDGDKITDDKIVLDIEGEFVLKVGKRKFAKVIPL
jgi:tyrosyl-tRNA synthetase